MPTNYFFLPVLACFLLTSCDDEKETKADFRDTYIGKYQVSEHIYSYGPPDIVPYVNTTKDTVISVTKGSTDSSLLVLGREVILDSNHEYYAYHYGLQFRNDSIFSNYMNGGLGGGQYEVYKGVRISKTP